MNQDRQARLTLDQLGKIFERVQKPGRYTGGEWNQVRKNPRKAATRVALIFPDVYEIGMSYLGQKILYSILNSRPSVLAERVFAPWTDFERELRAADIPLYSLENRIPLPAFDILGFSLLYELNYTNVLTVLDLGRVPVLASERGPDAPLVIAGGPAAFNPEPVADIFDLFFLGDGEEGFPEIIDRYADLKTRRLDKRRILEELASIEGVYVPSLYTRVRAGNSTLLVPRPEGSAPARVEKRVLSSFRRSHMPERIVVPNIQAVFDRVSCEAARGCPHRCRFCQATGVYFPFRIKSPSFLAGKMLNSLRLTGYEDASLSALSISDYPYLDETVKALMGELEKNKVSLSLSSLRPKGLSPEVAESIVKVRKTGFTLVPEAGTERLRRVINKPLTDQDIWDALSQAFSRGWRLVKLYFMIGLPTEKEEDLLGIIALVRETLRLGQKILGSPPRINLSVSSFIPKPHTPFQWLGMEDEDVLLEKQDLIRSELRRHRTVEIKEHPVSTSVLEGVFSRGDRKLGEAIREAWKRGARFDSWKDELDVNAWKDAFQAAGIDYRSYLGPIDRRAELPWDIIDAGIKKSALLGELDKALSAEPTPSCLEAKCGDCRGCRLSKKMDRVFEEPVRVPRMKAADLGRASGRVVRYRAIYEKRKQTRYLSHRDLIRILQRSFRRAGVPFLQSQGFHPQPLISYGPALPLGMEGKREVLEFKSPALFDEAVFAARVNKCLPSGIRFLRLEKLDDSAPALSRVLDRFVYSVKLRDLSLRAAAGKNAGSASPPGESRRGRIQELVDGFSAERAAGVELTVDRKKGTLRLSIKNTMGKNPRPQDIITELFGIEGAVHILSREDILLKGPARSAGEGDLQP